MNRSDDWGALGATWQQGSSGGGPAGAAGKSQGDGQGPRFEAAVEDLLRAVHRKRLSMIVFVSLELLCTIVASLILLRGILDPDKAIFAATQVWWSWLTLAMVWGIQAVFLYVRKGQWRVSTLAVADLLALMAGRARTAIRLVWLNLVAFGVQVLMTIPVLLSNWNIAARQERLLLLGKVALPAMLITLGICLLILQRQRRKLRRIEELRRGLGGES